MEERCWRECKLLLYNDMIWKRGFGRNVLWLKSVVGGGRVLRRWY